MGRLEAFLEKLAQRKPILSTSFCNIAWSGLMQRAAQEPFDFVLFDLEHGTLTAEGIEEALRVCRLVDLPTVVRVTDCVPHLISKTLDMGADGILIPRVETLEQVRIAIRSTRYYPRGRKGCGGFANFRPEEQGDINRSNDNRLLFIQIESQEGLDALPEILAECGSELAGILIGPYDASIMLGTPMDIQSPRMTAFIRSVFDLCQQHGLSCGSFVATPALIPFFRDLGGNIFWTGSEISMIGAGYRQLCQTFREETEG